MFPHVGDWFRGSMHQTDLLEIGHGNKVEAAGAKRMDKPWYFDSELQPAFLVKPLHRQEGKQSSRSVTAFGGEAANLVFNTAWHWSTHPRGGRDALRSVRVRCCLTGFMVDRRGGGIGQ